MKTKILLFAIALFSVFILNCSLQKETENKIVGKHSTSQIFKGKIIIVGNEPFTKLAVLINDSTSYIINAPKEIENELKKNQV